MALTVSGTDLYAGGSFTIAGNTPVNYVAKWNGTNWTSLGPELRAVSFNSLRWYGH
jgi:hypothetical protein